MRAAPIRENGPGSASATGPFGLFAGRDYLVFEFRGRPNLARIERDLDSGVNTPP
jgi:hypothetical protein